MIAGGGGARLDRPSMTAAKAALKARGCPPIFCENRFPPRPLRGAPLCSAALTAAPRSEEHTSELQSLMRISYAVFCLNKKKKKKTTRLKQKPHSLSTISNYT